MITQIVRCDQCQTIMADGKHRMPLLITLTIDRAAENTPPIVGHSHFCSSACVEAALRTASKPVEEAAHAVAS